jgi:pimeloyl-ACP methyl ester carboxylesterase
MDRWQSTERALSSVNVLVNTNLSSLRFFLSTFVFLLLILTPSARADTVPFRTYTQRDGLAANYITSIALTTDGTAWLGTPRGVTRVRDQYWVTYTAAHGLGSSSITGIAITTTGKTYVATNGGGLVLFDGSERKTYTTANSAIPSDYLTAVATDQQGRVWIGTLGYGVARLENEQWSKYTFTSNYISTLALDAAGHPWVATNDGVFFFDGRAWSRLTQAMGLASNRVNTIAFARDGRVWLGTDAGVTVFDGKTLRTYTQAEGLADNVVRALVVDAQNRVWLGTARGLSWFDGATWKTYTRAEGLAANHITALALDAQNRLWVGTTHGLSVMGAPLARAFTLPIVLVHGWHSAESDHIDDSEFHYFRHYLERDGFPVFYATGISPYKTLHQNAETLREVIAEVRARTGAAQVDLIAFSMGGLNARAYLESTLYQNDVRRVIILGTPQAGVRMWYPLLTRELEERPAEPSAIELTPEYAALFNRTHAPRATVPYDLLIGDARTQGGLEFLKYFPPSDGLIDVWSAHALSGPNVRRVTNSDVHAWEPLPLPLHLTSYLYPEHTYARWIRNALRDPDARPLGVATFSAEPTEPRNLTPMYVESLRAGETLTRTVSIDANRAVRFVAHRNSGEIELHLRAPDGTLYTPTNPREALYLYAPFGNFTGYALARAPVGTWSLVARRVDKGTQPLVLTLYADLDAEVRLEIATDRATYALGAPVTLRAALSNKMPAEMHARILWLGDGTAPRESARQVSLRATNLPGTYAVTLTDLSRGGYYLVRVTARAAQIVREQQLIFAISPATAKFTGETHARIEQGALVIETGVNVTRAGAFALSATVRGSRGQLITSLTAPLTLKTGVQVAAITIPGRDLRARGIDGPYNIELVLMDTSWAAVLVDELPRAITTEAYAISQFSE